MITMNIVNIFLKLVQMINTTKMFVMLAIDRAKTLK